MIQPRPMPAVTAPTSAPTLRRALGRWDLTAIGVNQVIGGAIFLMPSQVAAQIGAWAPIGMILMGIASLSVALCFAEVGSRFEGTGGPYLYTRAAFGRFAAFEVGWMQWFTRASSQASIMAGIAVALGYYWPVPAGEALDPRRHVPFALIATILSVTAVMTLAQVVAQGVLPDLAAHSTPIADASAVILGAGGALLVGAGSVVSMTGNNAGQVLSGSRMLFALAEHGELPAFFGRVHARFRTPANAVIFTSAIALALALTGSFAKLAVVSALARLVTYTGACAATLRLRSPEFVGRVKPATFVAPFGPLVPIIAIVVSMAVVAGATRDQLIGGLAALAAGAVLFAVNARPRTGT